MSWIVRLLPWWRGRMIYLPALKAEGLLSRFLVAVVFMVAIWWWVYAASPVSLAVLVPLVPLAVGPILYFRSWPIWDLLVWDSQQPWKSTPSEKDAGYEAMADAYVAVAKKRPDLVRAAVARVADLTPWRRVVATYYSCLADLIERKTPDLEMMAARAHGLEPGPRRDSAEVMLALLRSGAADLAGEDWRRPLIECRASLGIKMSIWRVLYPIRLFYAYLLIIFGVLVWLALISTTR